MPLLADSGYEVHAVSSKGRVDSLAAVATWHRSDLRDGGQIASLIDAVKPTHLLHFAWHVVPGKWATAAAAENFVWVQAGLELVRRFHEAGGQRIVVAGSCTEYDWNYGYCTEGLTPTNPSTVYGKCKNEFRVLLDAYAAEVKLSSAWGRIFFLFGPHEHPIRLVSSVCQSLLRDEPALCTHGNQIRDFLFVEDVADAFVALLESGVEGEINIASGQPLTLKDLIFNIADRIGRRELVRLGAVPVPSNETGLVVANIDRLQKDLGWRRPHTLDAAIEQTIDWWKVALKT